MIIIASIGGGGGGGDISHSLQKKLRDYPCTNVACKVAARAAVANSGPVSKEVFAGSSTLIDKNTGATLSNLDSGCYR